MTNFEGETKKKSSGRPYVIRSPLFLLSSLFILIGLLWCGCGRRSLGAGGGIFAASGMKYADTIPNTVKLSQYRSIQVNVTSCVKESENYRGKLEDWIIELLREKKLFEHVIKVTGPQESPADLQINAEIVALKKVNTLERVMADDYAGKAMVVVINRLKDLKTGEDIGTFTTGGQSYSGKTASLFMSGTTKQAVKFAAKQIVKSLHRHM